MTDSANLPAKSLPTDLALTSGQQSSLVARGLTAVLELNKHQLALTTEPEAEKLFRLGMRYRYGENGTPEDDEKARKYFLAAAAFDHAEAMWELSLILNEQGDKGESNKWLLRSVELGFGPAILSLVTDDVFSDNDWGLTANQEEELFKRACEWYEPRANRGDGQNQWEYADALLRRSARDWKTKAEGLRWLNTAAQNDSVKACERLAHVILSDDVTEKTTREGIHWLARAAELGSSWSCKELAYLYLHGHVDKDAARWKRAPQLRVAPDMKSVIAWYERAIDLGDLSAAAGLGFHYLRGEHIGQDLQQAEKWLLHAAKGGHTGAMQMLGAEYACGERLRPDTRGAIQWLELAAQRETSTGLKLAEIYLDGKIIARDIQEAIRWLDYATNRGFFITKAMTLVATRCSDGGLSLLDESAARAWMQRMVDRAIAAVADNEEAGLDFNALRLAELYDLGLGVEKDMEKAIYWYTQSAKHGLDKSKSRLKELGVDWESA